MENRNNINLNRTSLGSFEHVIFFIFESACARTIGRIKMFLSHSGKIPNSCKKCQIDVTEKCCTIVLLISRYRTAIYFSTSCCIRKSLNNNNDGNFMYNNCSKSRYV